jgi:hypothetical protein
MTANLIAIAALCLLTAGILGADAAPEQEFTPEPAIQAALAQWAAADAPVARDAAVARVRQLDSANRAELVRNLIFFTLDAQTTREGMVAGAVVKELTIPPRDVIDAVIPLLDTRDDKLKAQAANILGGYEDRSADRPPNYSVYREIIESADRADEPLPRGLIAHILATYPGHGLLTVARALHLGERNHAELRRVVWAEHVVADAIWQRQNGFAGGAADVNTEAVAQLGILSENEAWWVRLYVAEILRQHPAFRSVQLIDKLHADEDPLVRQVAEFLAGPSPQ